MGPQPFGTDAVSLMDDVDLDEQVVVNEFCWIGIVGHNSVNLDDRQ